MGSVYVAEKDGERFHVLPESMELAAAEGYAIYRLEEVEVENVSKEAAKAARDAAGAAKEESGYGVE